MRSPISLFVVLGLVSTTLAEVPPGVLGTYVRGPSTFVPGTPAAVRVAVHRARSEQDSMPAAGVDVTLRLSGNDHTTMLHHARSDERGVVDARFTVPEWPSGRYTLAIESRAGGEVERHEHAVDLAPGAALLLESDKPLYQPTQTIHLRVVGVRRQDGLPLGKQDLVFEVRDPHDNVVFREPRKLSEFGVAAADFTLADQILLGGYHARAALVDGTVESKLDVEVARYVLPRFTVAVDTDRAWYAPGDRAVVTLTAKYTFGQPVAGGAVTVDALLDGGRGPRVSLAAHRTTTDASGHARLELELPQQLGDGELSLAIDARVADTADHAESGKRVVPVARSPLRVEVAAEAGVLLPGVDNQVWAFATWPDGRPADGLDVELAIPGRAPVHARADRLGVAAFTVAASASDRGKSDRCKDSQLAIGAAFFTGKRRLASADRCLTIATSGGLRLRTDRAIVPEGASLTVDIVAPGAQGTAYLDVIKEGQTVDTIAVPLADGTGRATLPPDERRHGTLGLLAYHVAPDGTRIHDARLVHVARTAALTVELRPEYTHRDALGPYFRPGEAGKLHVHVSDAQSGHGTRAAVGVVMVDQALLALRAMPPGAARVYFTLATEAGRAEAELRARPGGERMASLVALRQLDETKQEAARILLAGAAPSWELGWEIDPWRERSEAFVAQRARVAQRVERYVDTHAAGERGPNGAWRYRHDLYDVMLAANALAASDARDPWRRPLSTAQLLEWAQLPPFAEHAKRILDRNLSDIYDALEAARVAKRLPVDAEVKRGRAVVLALSDIEALVSAKQLARSSLVDPWGTPLRLARGPRAMRIGPIRSRWLLASAGPDGVADTADDLYALDDTCENRSCSGGHLSVVGVPRAEAFTFMLRGCGCGYGMGGGGSGFGTIGLGSLGTIGYGGGWKGGGDRVRKSFPETMLWRPEVITDAAGDATLDVDMADSITTWMLDAKAIAADGRLGEARVDVRVYQDFFVDVELPPALTQHDEIEVPVTVYNYVNKPQRVTLSVDDAAWFERLGPATQAIDVAPGRPTAARFRLRVVGTGAGTLTVHAASDAARDGIQRVVDIAPDGTPEDRSWQDRLDAKAPATARVMLPADALADLSVETLKLYPAPVTHAIEGLDGMLRMPHGCFEQTSSTTYPNALVLDYLRRSGKATPDVEKKAREYLAAGYQRLLSFEVAGGGFSWFGEAPANQVLTAYGLREFHDMARVHPVDLRVIERTARWLESRQRSDGSWAPDEHFINEGATTRFNSDVARITAYIALALRRAGHDGPSVRRAAAYVHRTLAAHPTHDAYTLALAAELASEDAPAATLDGLLAQLWGERSDETTRRASSFPARGPTPTHGAGTSATVEATAVAARAMIASHHAPPEHVERAIDYLLGAKDSFGNWYSTQATILSLEALLAWQEASGKRARGRVEVRVDGNLLPQAITLDGDDRMQSIDLSAAARRGTHSVELRLVGEGSVGWQIASRWYEPRSQQGGSRGPLEVLTTVDDGVGKTGVPLRERVTLRAKDGAAVDMPIVRAGIPPGCDVDGEALDQLVKAGTVDKVERGPREVVFYLRALDGNRQVELPLWLVPRLREKVQIPAAAAWEYYRPERRGDGAPLVLRVDG